MRKYIETIQTYVKLIDESERFSVLETTPQLSYPIEENINLEIQRIYYEENSELNSGQAKFILNTSDLPSLLELYDYFYKKKHWRTKITKYKARIQSGIYYKNNGFLKRTYTFSELCSDIKENPDTSLGRTNLDLELTIWVNKKDFLKFKQDILLIPGFKNLWRIDKINEILI